MENSELKILLIALVIAAIVGGAWYFRDRVPAREPAPPPQIPVVETQPQPGEPLYPLELTDADASGARDLVPLPALDDSDSYFLLALVDLFGSDIETVFVSDSLIDRCVATIDNLTRSRVAENIRPVGSLAGNLLADPGDVEGQYFLSTENYRRYDALVGLVAGADVDAVAAMYRRFYPLLQEAYERLGYPNAYFNDRVVEVIDHLLAGPQPQEPVRLVRPHVLYEFADEDLKALSSGRKLLIRIGPANAMAIRSFLENLRSQVTSS